MSVVLLFSVRRLCCCALVLAGACGSKKDKPAPAPSPEKPAVAPPKKPDVSSPPPVVVQPEFPADTRSLQLMRTAAVRLDPGDDGKRIGTVAIDTRVGWTRTAKAKGCTAAWVEIKPRGWVCGDMLKPTKLQPFGREVPMLDRGEIVPGVYGKVTAKNAVTYRLENKKEVVTSPKELEARMVEDKPVVGSMTVRQYEQVTVGGKAYWRIAQKGNEYALASTVQLHTPSQFRGTRLGDDTGWALPFAFVWPRNNWQLAWSHRKPNAGTYRQLPAKMPVPILEVAETKDGKPTAYRIGEAEWLAAADARVFRPLPPPPLLRPNERWIDVDLDTQMLVAFEGELPVYATLISSGKKDTPTQTGLYRVWLKESEADMKNLKSEDPYSVSTVPWTQFFYAEDDLALHTAYWHNEFGRARSHGCVNLAPRDARWLYFWSDPQMPPGWTMTTGVVEAPGSVVRVRSAADPNPEWKGYAKKVVEARQPSAP